MRKIRLKTFASWLFISVLISCQKEVKTELKTEGMVVVQFNPVINGNALDFTANYVNDHAENYSVKAFKFYIHKIELVKNNNESSLISDGYHLLDAAKPSSLAIEARANASEYKSVAFTIGVDSARNVSGAQTGALDPINGMFWTWNTGYIMAKFEGSSPVSTQPGNRFEYHIGGFKGNENVVKRIVLDFPGSSTLEVTKEKSSTVHIEADANKWFSGTNQLPISSHAVCMTPGALAKSFAENYYNMFTVTGVRNN